ncbi:MAG TPA: S8 family peptidase [Thermoanaerobaculaceae bacterium]|nr:S8 family peptidase [Thermoanaerobaculaceae bacterium]HRS16814.1 S8 family peptidase [Thermoanaerobaculaceae bacterium]
MTRWVKVAEHLDPVAADRALSNDAKSWAKIIDVHGLLLNPDAPRHPHSASGYLRTAEVQRWVRAAVGNDFTQAVARFFIARDVVADLEDALPDERREVLIELRAEGSASDLDLRRKEVEQRLTALVGPSAKNAAIEPLRHFVAANLTRREVEVLRGFKDAGAMTTVWRDAAKSALIDVSTHTVQARPANESYGARGAGITWAVLDTGVWAGHPHFKRYGNVAAQWDCTRQGAPKKWDSRVDSRRLDGNGHGTHVAGIIAGWWRSAPADGADPVTYAGMAPEAKLHVYKVLGDDGRGRDSWIIKALDHIWTVNEKASELLIHGANLSLGGAFDPRVYGCGHSPLCRELLRLWRQGVAVVIAAGNEGIMLLQGETELREVSLDVSIGDPANLDEAIAVGSVHKSNPHTCGVSYFSSRGPTADGRPKPDLVAPGERVMSASFRAAVHEELPAELYVQMSGTSMAAPHVSGLLAAFLSLRRELIGRPDDVKKILLGNCTQLGRDPLFQGAGIPNLVKMLLST